MAKGYTKYTKVDYWHSIAATQDLILKFNMRP